MKVSKEVSFFKLKNRTYLFAPLSRTYISANLPMLSLLRRIDSGESIRDIVGPMDEALTKVVERLREKGVLVDAKPQRHKRLTEADKQTHEINRRLTVFPTSDCNMRCTYCYASGGDNYKLLSRKTLDIAMDFFFSGHETREGKADIATDPTLYLTVHGGGEPTLHFPLLRHVVQRFSVRALKKGYTPQVSLVTNGTYGEDVHDWLIKNSIGVSFSFDGVPSIQNKQRPYQNGKSSYRKVLTNIRRLRDTGRNIAIRSTITSQSVQYMRSTLELAATEGLAAVHFEPVTLTGRCLTEGVNPPEPALFSDEFLKCFKLGLKKDIEVSYSGMRCFDHAHQRFCSACGENYCLTPDGDITACYEVTSPDDPAASTFFIGKVDTTTGKVLMHQDRIAYLRTRSTENLTRCSKCFLRYNCAGDCLAKTYRYSCGDIFHPDPYRCQIAERVNKQLIAWLADGVIEPRSLEKYSVISYDCREEHPL